MVRKRGKVEEVEGWQDEGRKMVTQKLGPCSLSSQTHFSKKEGSGELCIQAMYHQNEISW